MSGRPTLRSAALAAIFGAALFAASCAQPGNGTGGAAGAGGPGDVCVPSGTRLSRDGPEVSSVVLRSGGLRHPLPPGRHRAPAPVRAARPGESLTARQPKAIGARRVIPGAVEAVTEGKRQPR